MFCDLSRVESLRPRTDESIAGLSTRRRYSGHVAPRLVCDLHTPKSRRVFFWRQTNPNIHFLCKVTNWARQGADALMVILQSSKTETPVLTHFASVLPDDKGLWSERFERTAAFDWLIPQTL